MSIAILHSRAQLGVDAPLVTIEVFLSGGLPTFSVVGMAETAVRESKDRVRGALLSSGFEFPQRRITVNLGPADMRKSGGRYDLAIALGILVASGQLRDNNVDCHEYFGELALNGELRVFPGALPAALSVAEAGRTMIVPAGNLAEASLGCEDVRPASCLLEVTAHLNELALLPKCQPQESPAVLHGVADVKDVRGQQRAKRALEIAAAGGHNLLLIGPPGAGKSMLAQRLPGLMPPMSDSEAIETAAIDSVLGIPVDTRRWRQRPFRAPHHTATAAALVGGGSEPRPGEISRAHNGVLFLDELPEFSRHVLEVLREPLETGAITISRATAQMEFPARFQLVAAMNPCPCGYLGDPVADCNCSADRVRKYREKISGPLLDRVDIQLEVQRPEARLLRSTLPDGEDSKTVAARVIRARQRQLDRNGCCNATLSARALRQSVSVSERAEQLLERATDTHGLSARCYQRMLRVATTIADLAGNTAVDVPHMAEALSLRGVSTAAVATERSLARAN